MKKIPLISFVIPVYKKDPEVFRECLRSLYDQSLKDSEVICVFDGKDEELASVAGEFPEVIQAVIEHGGAPKARNFGLSLAKGTYVVFWDADCYIKPDAGKRWIQEFEVKPDVDFVYTGYALSGERGGHDGEPFDYYSLTCGNYICSMSPIKREKAHLWDETLDGAQDWDYFLTACENGLKGSWIQGHAFITDAGFGISSKAWSAENRGETIKKIREKHGIPDRRIGVFSSQYGDRALKLAKILGGDIIKPSGKSFEEYDLLFILGFGFASRFDGVPESTIKIQYWIPAEIEALMAAQYKTVVETARIAKGVINYCGTDYEKNKLSEIGISAEVLPLPLAEEDLEKLSSSLPEKFKVLLVADEAYSKLLKELPQDLPHIEFAQGQASIKDCSCLMSFYRFAALDDAILVAHVNGRNVISNVQAPYCGFVDPDAEYEEFKKALYEKLREIRSAPFNQKAREYYLAFADPAAFREKILSLTPRVLELVS